MGFKNNWMEDLDSINEYLNVVHHGFDMHMAVGIMRLKDGCDYSAVISKGPIIYFFDSRSPSRYKLNLFI